jgi:hypothetical protein
MPTLIPAGHVTQIRFEISRAYMVFKGVSPDPDEWVEIDLDVPSGTLRTDKQIDWTLPHDGTMSLTVHFDLSKSIVQTGNGKYKLKPVLHLFNNDPDEAATICGSITAESFFGDGNPPKAVVRAIWNGIGVDETYTIVTVPKGSNTAPTEFCIYWLVPLNAGESYTIQIDNEFNAPYYFNDPQANGSYYEELVAYPKLESGVSSYLIGAPVSIIP